jgi:hypothetical protein
MASISANEGGQSIKSLLKAPYLGLRKLLQISSKQFLWLKMYLVYSSISYFLMKLAIKILTSFFEGVMYLESSLSMVVKVLKDFFLLISDC